MFKLLRTYGLSGHRRGSQQLAPDIERQAS